MNEPAFNELIKTHKRIPKSVDLKERCHSVTCIKYFRPLCVTNFTATTRALSTILNTVEYTSCNRRTIQDWSDDITADNCIYWSYLNDKSTKVSPKNFDSFEEYYRCVLINEKAAALDRLHIEINFQRRSNSNDLLHQQLIYDEKYREALIYNQTKNSDGFVFLHKYSEQEGITLDDASSRIIAMRKFQLDTLGENELIRQKYSKIILEESCFFNLPNIVSRFIKEMYEHATL